MSNHWMRRNQKRVLFFVCVFILPTFAVTGAISAFFGFRGSSVGSYEVEPGDRVDVTSTEFQSVQRRIGYMYGANDPDTVWMHLVLLREAMNCEISVSDEEVAKQALESMGVTTSAEYRKRLAGRGLSPNEWEKTIREMLTIGRYQTLMVRAPRVLEKDVLERYQSQNERREFKYVTFAAADYTSDFNPTDFKPEEVRTFWNLPKNSAIRNKRRLPQRFDMKLVHAPFDGFDESQAGDLAEGIEVTDDEIQAVYDDPENKERFSVKSEEDPADSSEEDGKDEDEHEGDDEAPGEGHEGEEDADEHEMKPLSEVRDSIEREIRLQKLMAKFREKAIEVQEKALADKQALSEWKEGESEGEKPVVKPLDLEALAGEYNFPCSPLKEKNADELAEYTTEEGATLSIFTAALQPRELSEVRTGSDGSAFLSILERRINPAAPPWEDVESEARELLMKDKAFSRAVEEAENLQAVIRTSAEKALDGVMPEFIREELKKKLEAEAEAKKKAEEAKKKAEEAAAEALKKADEAELAKKLYDEASTEKPEDDLAATDETKVDEEAPADEEEATATDNVEETPEEIVEDTETVVEEEAIEEEFVEVPAIELTEEERGALTSLQTWDQLVNKSLGKTFDPVITEKGLSTATLGPIKRVNPTDEEVESEEDEAKKTLMAVGRIYTTQEGLVQVIKGTIDREFVYVVKTNRIELPDYSEMTYEDAQGIRRNLRNGNSWQRMFTMGTYARQSPQVAGKVLERARLETEVRTRLDTPGAP